MLQSLDLGAKNACLGSVSVEDSSQDNKGNKNQAPLRIIYHVAVVGFRITRLHLNSLLHCYCFFMGKSLNKRDLFL